MVKRFTYQGKKRVTEPMTGDPYEDWKKTIGESHYDSPARRAIRFLNFEPETAYWIDPDDSISGELIDVIKDEYKDYIVTHLLLAFAEKTVEAFTALDNGDEDGFNNALKELEEILNEAVEAYRKDDSSATFTITGDPDNREYTTTLILEKYD